MQRKLGSIVVIFSGVFTGVGVGGMGGCQRVAAQSSPVVTAAAAEDDRLATSHLRAAAEAEAAAIAAALEPGGAERSEFLVEAAAVIRWADVRTLPRRSASAGAADWAGLNFTKAPAHAPPK
jgi:hypothetical protein